MSRTPVPEPLPSISVLIGQWAVARAPTTMRTLLGSCVAIILHDRAARIGGLAHIVLPDSRGREDGLGKYVDTAVPALLGDLARLQGHSLIGRSTFSATLVGGAAMFRSAPNADIGRQNLEASQRILRALSIPILAQDAGGSTGRNVTLDTASGVVRVRIPGGPSYDLSAGKARIDRPT
ncbi:chemotaxis protein CheD [Tautonia rosea]|uniref:chemotaxis protein CheD n=1 Tax=Tautonia rosea TaxID=2728037 RepID=UPI0028F44D96|nr:chemotaxis protein CheD [Tautonia rosea]